MSQNDETSGRDAARARKAQETAAQAPVIDPDIRHGARVAVIPAAELPAQAVAHLKALGFAVHDGTWYGIVRDPEALQAWAQQYRARIVRVE